MLGVAILYQAACAGENEMKRVFSLVLIIALLASAATACSGPAATPAPTPTRAPDTEGPFLEVSVSRLSIYCPAAVPEEQAYKYARMRFDFRVHNLTNEAVTLEEFEYAVSGDGRGADGAQKMVSGEHLDGAIAPYGTTDVDFPLPYISKDEDPALWSEMVEGNVIWTVEGAARIRTTSESLSVPFECVVESYSLSIDERCLEGN